MTQRRYRTEEAARVGHTEIVQKLEAGRAARMIAWLKAKLNEIREVIASMFEDEGPNQS